MTHSISPELSNPPFDRFTSLPILRIEDGHSKAMHDAIALEEPLEIRLVHGPENNRIDRTLSITMRTPGDDFALALGFLFTEGIVKNVEDIQSVRHCGIAPNASTSNVLKVELAPHVEVAPIRLERNFYANSGCGVCGKASLDALLLPVEPLRAHEKPGVDPSALPLVLEQLARAQPLFDKTGGVHASALFDEALQLVVAFEDVGRHNAVDKVIGWHVLNHKPLPKPSLLLASGRLSFEILQKALVARIGSVVAKGAPSSLAIDLALRYNMHLVGFLGPNRLNIYAP